MMFWYIVLAILLVIALILIFLSLRAVQCKGKARKLRSEKTYCSVDEQMEYANRLSQMIKCKTISQKAGFDQFEFGKLNEVVKELFPLFHEKSSKLTFGKNNDCWIYVLEGKDTSRNIMLMSHHDVVEATGEWAHPPFSGEIVDGAIWGRGTVDTKTPLFAEFSAIEELLQGGFQPESNLYIGSSNNEEIAGDGMPSALKYFQENKIKFEMILDEGGAIINAPMGGIKCKCAMLAVHEKGRHKLICTAKEGDGHTGLNPNTKTPVVRMAQFIDEISGKNIFIRRLYPQVRAMFESLAPYMIFPMRIIFANMWCFAPLLKVIIPKINEQAGSMLGTMCSFSSIKGGECDGVQSKQCVSTAFLRCVDDKDLAVDIESFAKVAKKYNIDVKDAPQGNEYHRGAELHSEQLEYVKNCVGKIFPHVAAAPFVLPAGTDARHFSDICPNVIRFAPISINPAQYASVHSPNEHIGIKAVADSVVFYKDIISNYK